MRKLTLATVLIAVTLFSSALVGKTPSPLVAKSLVFPVAGKKASVQSFWGDVRDGGKRKHEGIDIFAKKGTPVIAICDGFIVSKGNTPRGGKTLWLQSAGHAMSIYYAHLDKQLARKGQFVRKGQVIGTVGNTGNARTTPAHLHFGIYTWKGSVNPLPYVKKSPRIVSPKLPKQPTATVAKKKGSQQQRSSSAFVKTVVLTSEPGTKYHLTRSATVVRSKGGKKEVIGHWRKGSATYPNIITLSNKRQLYVNKAGKITTTKG